MNWILKLVINRILRNTETETISRFTKLVSGTIITSKRYENDEIHNTILFCLLGCHFCETSVMVSKSESP